MGRIPKLNIVTALFAVLLSSCNVEFVARPGDQPIVTGSSVFPLLEIQSNRDNALNIVFVPDGSYGDMSVLANRQAFLDDLELVIEDGYWENQAYYYNLGKFNYYYMNRSGTVSAATSGTCPTVTWPAEVDSDAAFADLVLLLHTNELRDCRWGRKATSEPTSFRTIVHESSHALYNIPDEYCCDGGYYDRSPILYSTQAGCTGDAANAAWRNCVSFTADSGPTWWRSEGSYSSNEIMISAGATVWEMGPGDWAAAKSVLTSLGSPTASTPNVFAPAGWTNPNTP